LAASAPASAQDFPRVDVSGGYQGMIADEEFFTTGWYFDVAGNVTSLIGIVFQVGGNSKSFSETNTFTDPGFPPFVPATTITDIVDEDFSLNQYMGGVRLNARGGRVTPFGQFLVGVVKSSSEGTFTSTITFTPPSPAFPPIFESESFSDTSTDFAIQVGGGVDIRIAGGFGIRAGGDYLRVSGEEEAVNMFRFAVGALYSF
ncbi:MAG TPA: outer membrane beta-barrel protein, partial [Vicinamibacterales bacterium]|nr:outer membrane beta-barrel protein [Vicinamibacterales bacterium]